MSEVPLHVVLVTPEIPANTGNIVRTCAVTGVALHLVEPLGFGLDDRLVRRAGLDYWRDCQLQTHLTFEDIQTMLPESNFHYLSARAEVSLYDRRIAPGDALVFGPETTGLSARFLDQGDRRSATCRLPMPGRGRSLNLSVAVGIAVYECLRRLERLQEAACQS